MDKSNGIEHYEKKLKKKNHSKNLKTKKKKSGNSYSGSILSTSYGMSSTRMEQIRVNKVVEKYHIEDFKEFHTSKPPNKSILPFCESTNKVNNLNKQIHPKKINNEDLLRYVHLPVISSNLFIGNENSIEIVNDRNIQIVINMSNRNFSKSNIWKANENDENYLFDISYNVIKTKGFGTMTSYRMYKDTNYENFIKASDKICKIINEAEESNMNVLVICQKGVNHSVAAAIAYAKLYKEMTVYDASKYIDNTKFKFDKNWNNLTNRRIVSLLKTL
tara:strand:- start:238 stop:1062 length:825 start_codon:yes stop_codon:yes gene_type:complete